LKFILYPAVCVFGFGFPVSGTEGADKCSQANPLYSRSGRTSTPFGFAFHRYYTGRHKENTLQNNAKKNKSISALSVNRISFIYTSPPAKIFYPYLISALRL
jgi:hypothetical protein